MVNTRASVVSNASNNGKRASKRRRSDFELVAEHSDSSQPQEKTRKTRRHFKTADEQLRKELDEASEAEQIIGSSPPPRWPTKSQLEHDNPSPEAPSGSQIPECVQFMSLEATIRQRNEVRRRQANNPKGPLVLSQNTNTYIDLADLNIDAQYLATPSASFGPQQRDITPLTAYSRSTPDKMREQKIGEYEHAIEKLAQEKADAFATLQILDLGVQGLGFGDPGDNGNDVCAAIRTAFDQARADASELLKNHHIDVEELENGAFLERLVDVIRGLLYNIEQTEKEVRDEKEMIVFVRAQYNGVVEKLAEAAERQNELRKVNDKLDKDLDTRTRDLDSERKNYEALLANHETQTHDLEVKGKEILVLRNDKEQQAGETASLEKVRDALNKAVENLEAQIERIKQEYDEQVKQLEADHEERIDYMIQELNQEHWYRRIAEKDAASKDAEFTSLQVQFEGAKCDHEKAEDEVAKLKNHIIFMERGLNKTKSQLIEKERAIENLDEQVAGLNDRVDEMTVDIRKLSKLRDDARKQFEQTCAELEESTNTIIILEQRVKDADLEVNKLRGNVFGTQQEIKDLMEDRDATQDAYNTELAEKEKLQSELAIQENVIENLQRAVDAQDKAMVDLKIGKDKEILEKNELLDQLEAEKERMEQDYTDKVDEKDAQIEGLRADVDDVTEKLADANETTETLHTEVASLTMAGEEKDAEISQLKENLASSHRHKVKLESDVQVRDADIEALRKEVFETTSERDILKKSLSTKEKELTMVMASNAKLVDSSEHDAMAAKEWAERKIMEAREGRAVVDTLGGVNGVVDSVQVQTQKKLTRVVKRNVNMIRDSGFMGSDGFDEVEGEAMEVEV